MQENSLSGLILQGLSYQLLVAIAFQTMGSQIFLHFRNMLKPWATIRNALQKGVDGRFTTDDARIKLKHLYPIIKI